MTAKTCWLLATTVAVMALFSTHGSFGAMATGLVSRGVDGDFALPAPDYHDRTRRHLHTAWRQLNSARLHSDANERLRLLTTTTQPTAQLAAGASAPRRRHVASALQTLQYTCAAANATVLDDFAAYYGQCGAFLSTTLPDITTTFDPDHNRQAVGAMSAACASDCWSMTQAFFARNQQCLNNDYALTLNVIALYCSSRTDELQPLVVAAASDPTTVGYGRCATTFARIATLSRCVSAAHDTTMASCVTEASSSSSCEWVPANASIGTSAYCRPKITAAVFELMCLDTCVTRLGNLYLLFGGRDTASFAMSYEALCMRVAGSAPLIVSSRTSQVEGAARQRQASLDRAQAYSVVADLYSCAALLTNVSKVMFEIEIGSSSAAVIAWMRQEACSTDERQQCFSKYVNLITAKSTRSAEDEYRSCAQGVRESRSKTTASKNELLTTGDISPCLDRLRSRLVEIDLARVIAQALCTTDNSTRAGRSCWSAFLEDVMGDPQATNRSVLTCLLGSSATPRTTVTTPESVQVTTTVTVIDTANGTLNATAAVNVTTTTTGLNGTTSTASVIPITATTAIATTASAIAGTAASTNSMCSNQQDAAAAAECDSIFLKAFASSGCCSSVIGRLLSFVIDESDATNGAVLGKQSSSTWAGVADFRIPFSQFTMPAMYLPGTREDMVDDESFDFNNNAILAPAAEPSDDEDSYLLAGRGPARVEAVSVSQVATTAITTAAANVTSALSTSVTAATGIGATTTAPPPPVTTTSAAPVAAMPTLADVAAWQTDYLTFATVNRRRGRRSPYDFLAPCAQTKPLRSFFRASCFAPLATDVTQNSLPNQLRTVASFYTLLLNTSVEGLSGTLDAETIAAIGTPLNNTRERSALRVLPITANYSVAMQRLRFALRRDVAGALGVPDASIVGDNVTVGPLLTYGSSKPSDTLTPVETVAPTEPTRSKRVTATYEFRVRRGFDYANDARLTALLQRGLRFDGRSKFGGGAGGVWEAAPLSFLQLQPSACNLSTSALSSSTAAVGLWQDLPCVVHAGTEASPASVASSSPFYRLPASIAVAPLTQSLTIGRPQWSSAAVWGSSNGLWLHVVLLWGILSAVGW